MKFSLVILLILAAIMLMAEPLLLTGNVPENCFIEQKGCLETLLQELDIDADAVLLMGADSTTAYIERSALKMVFLHPSEDLWLANAPALPPVCNIKNLSEICIYQSFWQKTLLLNNKSYTPFTWRLADLRWEANSEKNGYQAVKYLPGESNVILPENRNVMFHFADGSSQGTTFKTEFFTFNGFEWYYQQKVLRKVEVR